MIFVRRYPFWNDAMCSAVGFCGMKDTGCMIAPYVESYGFELENHLLM